MSARGYILQTPGKKTGNGTVFLEVCDRNSIIRKLVCF